MEPLIEYFFGTGDGATTTWSSPADVDVDTDGIPDAVRLDFDGDGLRDDAMWDSDGNGTADAAILDVDGRTDRHAGDGGANTGGREAEEDVQADGGTDPRVYRDTGSGVWDERVWNVLESGRLPAHPESGAATDHAADLDGDGRPDVQLQSTPHGLELFVDSDGDGAFDRVIIDSDGDGRADATREAPHSD